MKCILKIHDSVLSSFLGKDEFDSYSDFFYRYVIGIANGTIPIGNKIVAIESTEHGFKIPSLGDLEVSSVEELIQVSLTQAIPENLELTIEDQSHIITPTDNSTFSLLDRPPYVYTLSKIYIKEEKDEKNPKPPKDLLDGEEEVALIKNQVVKAVEEILDIQPDREFFIRLELDSAENVQNADPSTFKVFGVVGVLYEKVGNDFKRVYIKSYDKNPIGKAEITINEKEAVKIGWNQSKLFTLTVPDFSKPKYKLRKNPVNADVIAEITRIRVQALKSPSNYFKVKGFWQEFPTDSPINLETFLQGRNASVQIASDTDRIFYKGNLFLRLDGEKIPTNRTPLKNKQPVLDLVAHDYSNNLSVVQNVVDYLNNLLSYKGGDVTFYVRGNKIVVYRHSKKIDGKIQRIKAELVPLNELSDLLDYAKINVNKYALNSGALMYSVFEGEVTESMLSAEDWEKFYLNHHTTSSRQINVEGKPYFFSAKSFLFDLESSESQNLKVVSKQIENPKIGNLEISPNTQLNLKDVLNNTSDLLGQVDETTKEVLEVLSFLAQNEKSAKSLENKTVEFVTNRSSDFKGVIVGDVIQLNYNLITNPNLLGSVLAHESIHALTVDWLKSNSSDPLTKRLTGLLELVPESVSKYHQNIYELLASVANPEIAKELKNVKIENSSLLERIIDSIKEIIAKILGVNYQDNLYSEIINKIVAISTKESTQEEKPKNKFGLKKRDTENLPLGYDENSLNEYLQSNDLSKSDLNELVKSIDGDLANYIHNKGLLQDFITGKLNFVVEFRNLFNNYVDESELKPSFSKREEKFYSLLSSNSDFVEDYWIQNTEFAKIRTAKKGEIIQQIIEPSEEDIQDVKEESERHENEKQITDGEDVTNDKFFERTGMEISSIDAADKVSRIFVKMIPAIERDNGQAKLYTEESKNIFINGSKEQNFNDAHPEQASYFLQVSDKFIKFKTNSLGRIELNDYYYTWNTLADKLEGSLSLEEMISKIENDPTLFKILPEAFVFADRLKAPITNSFQAEVKQKLEASFKRARVGIYVVLQNENGFHLINEGKDVFPTFKNFVNTNFLNSITTEFEKFYNQEVGKFNIQKYFESKKGLFREDGSLDITKVEGALGDKVLNELGFVFDTQTIWDTTNENRNESFLDFKRSLLTFLSNFEFIDIQIGDFISTDQINNGTKIPGLNAKFKKVINREDSFKPIVTSLMVKNAEGENQSTLSLFNSILKDRKYYNDSQTLEELNENVTRTKNDMFDYSISKRLMFDENQRNGNKLQVDTLSGKKEVKEGSQSKGSLTVDLSESEWFLFNYVTMLKGGLIENTRAETATTCYGFRLNTWNKNYQQNTPFSITDIEQVFKDGKYKLETDSYVFKVWSDYLRGEISRIQKGGKTFGLFSNILSSDLKSKLNSISDVNTYADEIKTALEKFFNDRFKDYEYYFKLMGGQDAFKVYDEKKRDFIETDVYKDFERYKDARKAWFDLNAMTLHVEETILFQGDISEGWKYFKRAKSVQSTGTPVSNSPSQIEWLDSELSKLSFGQTMGTTLTISDRYKSGTIKDDVKESEYFKTKQFQEGYVESKRLYNEQLGVEQSEKEIKEESELFLSPYAKTNIGDGDAFAHPDFYFALLNQVGSINQDQILGYKALVLDFRKNAIDYLTKEELKNINTTLTKEEEEIRQKGLELIAKGKVVFPKLKFTQRGPGFKNGETGPVVKEVMDKFAITPLFPQFTKGKAVANALLKQMIKEERGYVKFESGTKIANFGISDFINKVEKGEIEVSLEDSAHELKSEHLAEQIKTPNKTKEKNTFGSQFRKLIQSGLSIIGMETEIKEWENLNQEFSNLTKQEVLEDFGITENNGQFDYSNIKMEKVADILLRESKRRDLPENLVIFFDKFKQGTLSAEGLDNYYKHFEASLGNQQIQNLLASIIKKIAVQKLSGAQLIQVSSSIFDRDKANKKGKTRELGFYHFKDGKVQAAECKVAMIGDFKNLLTLPEVKDRLEVNGKEDNILNRTDALNDLLLKDNFIEQYRDQLTIVGYRIPTQGFNSMEVMVIREFLPAFYGPTLVCPPEITTQSGTDYDYDKFSVLFPSIRKNGQMADQGIKGIQNKMIKSSSNILLNPLLYHKLITPNSSDYIFDKVKPVLKNLNIQFEEPRGSMVVTLKGNYSKFRALKGKNLLGIAAIWNTFFSLMQRHKWELNSSYGILDFKGNTLVSTNVNPVLLSEQEKQKRIDSDGKLNISIPTTVDGFSKSEIISQLINVTVDMPTDDTFGQTNFDRNDFSAGIYASSVLGYDFDSILNLWHQPIIYQYKQLVSNLVKKGNEFWKAKLLAISELLQEEVPTSLVQGYPIQNFDQFQINLFKKDGILENRENNLKLATPNFNIEEVAKEKVTDQQKNALAHYLKLLNQADAIRVVQSSLNFDTSPDNSMMKVNQREENYDKAVRSNLISKSDIDQVKKDSVISGLYTSNILKGIIKQLFPVLYSDENLNFFGQVSSNYRDSEKAYRALSNDFLLSIVQNFAVHDGLIFNTAIEYLQKQKSLELTKQAKSIKKKLNKEGIDMRLLNILVVSLSTKRSDRVFNQQIFLGFENSPEDKNRITEEFKTLLNREDTKQFAETLAIIGIVQSGWAKSPLYFSDLIPEEFLTPIIAKAFDSYLNLTSTQKSRFRKVFLDNFKEYEAKSLGKKRGQVESFRLMDYTRNINEIYTKFNDLGEVETQDVSYEEIGSLQLESGNLEEKGKLQMQPDNISKILSNEKTITNRTEKLEDGIYELPNGVQVELEYIGEWKVFDDGTSRIYQLDMSGAKLKSMLKDDFAKAEGFKDWADFEQNNKFSKNFINGNQSRYVYSIKPLRKVQQSNEQKQLCLPF